MAELEELEQEALDEKLLDVGVPATDQLPSVPTAEPAAPIASECRMCEISLNYQKKHSYPLYTVSNRPSSFMLPTILCQNIYNLFLSLPCQMSVIYTKIPLKY